jgi:hypothetical protein
MPGLVPGIHVLSAATRKTRMAGASPAMTMRTVWLLCSLKEYFAADTAVAKFGTHQMRREVE